MTTAVEVTPSRKGLKIGLVGFAMVAVSVFCPWVTSSVSGMSGSAGAGAGAETLFVAALGGFFLALRGSKIGPVLAGLAALLLGVDVYVQTHRIDQAMAHTGWGLHLMLIGAVVALVGAVISARSQS